MFEHKTYSSTPQKWVQLFCDNMRDGYYLSYREEKLVYVISRKLVSLLLTSVPRRQVLCMLWDIGQMRCSVFLVRADLLFGHVQRDPGSTVHDASDKACKITGRVYTYTFSCRLSVVTARPLRQEAYAHFDDMLYTMHAIIRLPPIEEIFKPERCSKMFMIIWHHHGGSQRREPQTNCCNKKTNKCNLVAKQAFRARIGTIF